MARLARRNRIGVGRLLALAGRASRYDLVLAVIPAAFAAAVLLGRALSVPSHAAVAGAGLVAVLALLDALFLNPPTGPPTGRRGA